ncbi:hypothetical protein AB0P21_22855 [Kribbella sp. NPDC056861]|uniref:hypothetical protein n=1 Tax=Kribbella sp. NPDC056861 TaxID=3154857 RepID=UPI003441EC03
MGGAADWRRRALVFGLIVVGVVLALTCVNAGAELDRRRRSTCDATLSLPVSAYVLVVVGLLVGLAALFLLARWFGAERQVIVVVLFATAVSGVVFEIFALLSAVHGPGAPVCRGA